MIRVPFPLEDGSTAILEIPYVAISAVDADRITAVAACLVVETEET
jgi:hypothetical protein